MLNNEKKSRAALLNQRSYIVSQDKTILYNKPQNVVLDSPIRKGSQNSDRKSVGKIGLSYFSSKADKCVKKDTSSLNSTQSLLGGSLLKRKNTSQVQFSSSSFKDAKDETVSSVGRSSEFGIVKGSTQFSIQDVNATNTVLVGKSLSEKVRELAQRRKLNVGTSTQFSAANVTTNSFVNPPIASTSFGKTHQLSILSSKRNDSVVSSGGLMNLFTRMGKTLATKRYSYYHI